MSEIDPQFVKRGYWVDISKGQVMGQTITTDTRTGVIVVDLLAILLSIGATHLWYILTFAYYQAGVNGRPKDALFKQQQAFLRTLPTASAVMAENIRLRWAWRGKVHHSLARSVLPILLAVLFSATMTGAGIFSSYAVSTSNNEVLISSSHCGRVNITKLSEYDQHSMKYWEAIIPEAYTYSQNCYYQYSSILGSCQKFSKPRIPFQQTNTTCPFSPLMCDTEAVSFDSGLLDMNEYFGLNFLHSDRMKFRKRTTCAVLPLTGHWWTSKCSALNIGFPFKPDEECILLSYGSRPAIKGQAFRNTSFYHRVLVAETAPFFYQYGLTAYSSPEWKEDDILHGRIHFDPMPEMTLPNADTALVMFSANQVVFESPVNDPIFSAHKTWNDTAGSIVGPMYLADWIIRAVGCAEQYQFCFNHPSSRETCTELGSLVPRVVPQTFPGLSSIQIATLQTLLSILSIADISIIPPKMQAVTITAEISTGLPDNQWVIELYATEAFVWSAIQLMIADYAIGPKVREPDAEAYSDWPTTDGDKRLCKSYKMRKTGGIAHKLGPKIDEWIQDSVWQLQRRAYEGQGYGTWTDLEKDIPTTEDGDLLPSLTELAL